MSDNSNKSQIAAFIGEVKRCSATRIMDLGAEDPSLFLEIVEAADWASKIELHCTGVVNEAFDQQLVDSAENRATEFEVVKHVGSDSEVNDAILELALLHPFDAAFISSSSSKEALLTSMLVCHESLKLEGVLGLSSAVVANPSLSDAISSFRDMLGDAYQERQDHIFVRV